MQVFRGAERAKEFSTLVKTNELLYVPLINVFRYAQVQVLCGLTRSKSRTPIMNQYIIISKKSRQNRVLAT